MVSPRFFVPRSWYFKSKLAVLEAHNCFKSKQRQEQKLELPSAGIFLPQEEAEACLDSLTTHNPSHDFFAVIHGQNTVRSSEFMPLANSVATSLLPTRPFCLSLSCLFRPRPPVPHASLCMATRMCLAPTSAARQQAHIVALTQPVIAPLFEARRTTKPLLWIASPFLSFSSNKAAGMGRDHHHSSISPPSALKSQDRWDQLPVANSAAPCSIAYLYWRKIHWHDKPNLR